MKFCNYCKHVHSCNDNTLFCDLTLPPWMSVLFPDRALENISRTVGPFDTCSFWEQMK